MGKSLESLREAVRELRLQGHSPPFIREKMVQLGWDAGVVDRMLWQLKLRDRKNSYFTSKLRRVTVALLIFSGFVGLVFGTLSYESYQKNRKEAALKSEGSEGVAGDDVTRSSQVTLRGQPMVSEVAGVQFDYPSNWTVTEYKPEEIGGAYQWQLEHTDNKPVKEALQQKYDIASADSDAATVAELALLNDPLVENLTTVTITVYKAPDFEIEPSLLDWRTKLEQASGKIGFWAENFQDVNFAGIPGYAYTTRVEFGQVNIMTSDYLFLDPSKRRIEISAFPLKTKYASEVEAILSSIQL